MSMQQQYDKHDQLYLQNLAQILSIVNLSPLAKWS